MLAIYLKEMRAYFISAVGYVYSGIFLASAALICCYTTLISNSYDTSSYFTLMIFAFVVLLPLLTMKLFAEEKKLRTEQLLLTAPVKITSMVFGKFLAAMTLFAGTTLLACANFIPLYHYGNIERGEMDYQTHHVGPVTGEIVGCIIGVLLIGAAFIAIGLFISSLCENQLSAAIITISILLVSIILNLINNEALIPSYPVRFVIDWFCMLSRFSNFSYGIFDFSALLYYVSVSAVFLFLTVRVYEKRRWA